LERGPVPGKLKGRGDTFFFAGGGRGRVVALDIFHFSLSIPLRHIPHSYNPETGQLTITYRGDRRYSYDGVPPELADGLEKADSKGRYVHAHIIDKFPATRIRLDD
jgi:hypothetical protein